MNCVCVNIEREAYSFLSVKKTRVASLTSFFFLEKKRVKRGTRKLENKIKELVSIFIQIQVLKANPTGLHKT